MSKSKLLLYILLPLIVLSLAASFTLYKFVLSSNTKLESGKQFELFIRTGSGFDDVLQSLHAGQILRNTLSFQLIANKMNYPNHIKPGRYIIHAGMSNFSMIRKLRSGNQDPIKLVLNNIDSKQELDSLVATKLECEPSELYTLLNDKEYLSSKGYTIDNALTAIIANTYEFYWNTNGEGFMKKMLKENKRFWNDTRIEKAKKIGLSPIETTILASIVQKESNKRDEYPMIAGVYINRLKANWPLQADPTVKFALGQPGLKRILKVHLSVQSPYNTYGNTGLPPGPICLPEIYAIDAVLNADIQGYMFFCAKDDFSGYHVFARSIQEHNSNARKYQAALNEQKIYK